MIYDFNNDNDRMFNIGSINYVLPRYVCQAAPPLKEKKLLFYLL